MHACSNDNAGSNDDTVASLAILSNPQLSGDSVFFPLVSSLPSDNQPSSVASYYRTNAAVSPCNATSGPHARLGPACSTMTTPAPRVRGSHVWGVPELAQHARNILSVYLGDPPGGSVGAGS